MRARSGLPEERVVLQGLASGGRATHAHEQPRPRRGRAAAGSRRLRRHRHGGALVGGLRRDRRRLCGTLESDETAPGAVGQAGRRVPDARDGAARLDLELDARSEVGRLGHVPRARAPGPHDVRSDDGRLVDLHRDAGHPPGNVRDARRGRDAALRRLAPRNDHADGRARRHGRSAAARRHDERRRRALRRGRPGEDRAQDQDPLSGSRNGFDLDEAVAWAEEAKLAGEAVSIGLLGNCAEVEPELLRRGFKPDIVTDQTSAHDPLGGYVPAGFVARGGRQASRVGTGGVPEARVRVDGAPLRSDGWVPRRRRGDVRLREQPAGRRRDRWIRARLRVSGVRTGVRETDVLRGQGTVPLGGA